MSDITEQTTPAFDPRDFRRALSQFPTGVTVITVRKPDGEHVGVTASSFNSVSVDPALVLWSVDKSAMSAPIFESCEHFAVNVLTDNQVGVSNRFASRGEDKFKDFPYQESANGCALFDCYAAQFECDLWNVYEGGDHLIIVGKVTDYRYKVAEQPLVFSRGGYAMADHHLSSVQKSAPTPVGGFVGDYMHYFIREIGTRYSAELYPQLTESTGVTIEEWRVIALLADKESMQVADIVPVVMQPHGKLCELLEWLSEKGHVEFDGETEVKLTGTGRVVAEKLLSVAKIHEAEVLSVLDNNEVRQLKDLLGKVLGHMKS